MKSAIWVQIRAFDIITEYIRVFVLYGYCGGEALTSENQAAVEAMKSALDNSTLPQDMALYRGTSTEALGSLQNLSIDELVLKHLRNKVS